MPDIEFALVLNLHQPSGNLEHLLDVQEWHAREILSATDRIPGAVSLQPSAQYGCLTQPAAGGARPRWPADLSLRPVAVAGR